MAKRGGTYPGRDIPEFYALVEELFTPEEAAVYNAIPKGFHPAEAIAKEMGKEVDEVRSILEGMANKGLCTAGSMGGATFYGAPVFVPGIFEFQFMRGTKTARDKKLAPLIRAYKAVLDAERGLTKITYPINRVIPVNKKIEAGNTIHTYQQVASYIEKYQPLSVSTCFWLKPPFKTKRLSQRLKRCATQNRLADRLFPQPLRRGKPQPPVGGFADRGLEPAGTLL